MSFETKEYTISESFKNISIDAKTADIVLVKSENSECTVNCYEQENMPHSVSTNDGTLTVKLNDTRKWYEHLKVNFTSPKITVYLPADKYDALSIITSTGKVEISKDFSFESIEISGSTGKITNFASAKGDVKLEVSTGKILVSNINAGSLDVKVSTGDANISSVRCKSFASDGSTGDIELEDVIAEERLTIKRNTGDISFDGCDAGELFIQTSTGNVEGSLLSEKIFIVDTDTGSKKVPSSTVGGKCEIKTDTGNIKISIK